MKHGHQLRALADYHEQSGEAITPHMLRQLSHSFDADEPAPPTEGAALIAAERQRQIDVEGYSLVHDTTHLDQELVQAAREYLTVGDFQTRYPGPVNPDEHLNLLDDHGLKATSWPWRPEDFKPTSGPIGNYVKAGALLAAEIDRLIWLGERLHVHVDQMTCERDLRDDGTWTDWRICRNPRGQHADEPAGLFMDCPGQDDVLDG